jgi:predicted Fe-Mo cluster-binding NifX family protein
MTRTRLAVTVWDDRIAPVFDTSRRWWIVDVEGSSERSRRQVTFKAGSCADRLRRLRHLGIDTLVCGAITQAIETRARAMGIRVISFVTGPADDIVSLVATGHELPDAYAMPGSVKHQTRQPHPVP